MSILFRYLAREILWATLLLLAALLALFALFDLIREMGELGKGSYRLATMAWFVLLSQPAHVVVIFPVAALMGTMFAIARLSSQSELTVMRASGLSLARLAGLTALIGLALSTVVFLFGEYVAPASGELAKRAKLAATSSIVARQFRSGFWIKDDLSFINIQNVSPQGELQELRIYEFDREYRLTAISMARAARFDEKDARWQLEGVEKTSFSANRAQLERLPSAIWNSAITPALISVLLVRPDAMPVTSLWAYIDHLRENKSNSTQYELALFGKLFQPLTTIVMMLIAIPFAIQSQRARGVGGKLMAGILIGLAFYFLNQLAGNLTVINNWPPLLSTALPLLLVLAIAAGLIALRESAARLPRLAASG
ncbi:MAG TPA: LPS export ABC transporter permease LptG [Usitatibacteraceae bacterium]|nr:LPS export ABC transporter permease LptG [Usitatibacteraceae bacterium]